MALRAFYAQCTLIDHQIRRLVGTLRENGLLDNTVIGFISDHGDMLFNHGMVAKRVFYQESSNVPFILSGKPLEKYRGTVTDKLCALEDIMPTLLNIFDIPVPETVEGVDILSSEREMLFGEISEGVKATRMATDGRYKLIYYPYGNVKQLFDLENDPEEHHDLGNKVEYKAIQEKLEAYLKKEDIEYHLDEEDPDRILVIFQTRQLSNVSLDITVLNSRTVLFLSRLPLNIPKEFRPAVCEYITRVNYGVILGGFELNLDDGDLNYKIVGALGRENEIDREAFCRLLYLGNSMLDKYAPGILAILYGGKNAEEAYRSITKSND